MAGFDSHLISPKGFGQYVRVWLSHPVQQRSALVGQIRNLYQVFFTNCMCSFGITKLVESSRFIIQCTFCFGISLAFLSELIRSGKLIIICNYLIIQNVKIQLIMEVNEIYCIGSNKFGQAGAGKKYHNQNFNQFTKIIFPVFIKQVVCGSHHTGLLTIQGLVYMTGSNINGVLGTPSSNINYSYSPILVENLSDISKISSGYYHMSAISDGKLYTWGKGVDGQLGTGKQINNSIPTLIESFGEDVEQVSCGLNHTLVKTINRKCYGFGNGIYGQLGVGNNKNSLFPIQVKISQVSQIAAGQNFSLFLKDGTIFGSGDNSNGQISVELKKKYAIEPTQIKLEKVTSIKAGKIALAVIEDRSICIWGMKNLASPFYFKEFQEYVMDVQTGGSSIYCLSSQGELYEWNTSNSSNQFRSTSLSEKTILGFSVGESHSMVLSDIIGQVNSSEEPLRMLENILQAEDSSASKILSKKSSISNMMRSNSLDSEQPSINLEHGTRTPSTIMREPTNFLKGQSKSKAYYQQCPKTQMQSIQVGQFLRQKSFAKLNVTTSNLTKKQSELQFEGAKEKTTTQPFANVIPTKKQSEMSDCLQKIENIMNLLEKNSKIDENINGGNRQQLSRRVSHSRLQKNENKQNKCSDRADKVNRELIMQLRQKQLKISQLQEKLSRKDIQIESQRQLIQLLRRINTHPNDIHN